MAYIGDNTPQKEKSKGMGQLGAMAGVVIVIGPLMGGLLSTDSLSRPFFIGSGSSRSTGDIPLMNPDPLHASRGVASVKRTDASLAWLHQTRPKRPRARHLHPCFPQPCRDLSLILQEPGDKFSRHDWFICGDKFA
jgi:hypothetical protein